MSVAVVLAVLLLHPVLDAAGPVRLVAAGTGDEPVRWVVDGRLLATTADGEATDVVLSAGGHEVKAESAATGDWRALARADPSGREWRAVPAWSASHASAPIPGPAVPLLALTFLGASSWVQARRQSKRT
jgi:hypothetical protein